MRVVAAVQCLYYLNLINVIIIPMYSIVQTLRDYWIKRLFFSILTEGDPGVLFLWAFMLQNHKMLWRRTSLLWANSRVSATCILFLMFLLLNSLFASYFLELDMTKQPKFCLLNSTWTRRTGLNQFSWAVLAHSQHQLLWNSSSSPLQHHFGFKIFSCLLRKS